MLWSQRLSAPCKAELLSAPLPCPDPPWPEPCGHREGISWRAVSLLMDVVAATTIIRKHACWPCHTYQHSVVACRQPVAFTHKLEAFRNMKHSDSPGQRALRMLRLIRNAGTRMRRGLLMRAAGLVNMLLYCALLSCGVFPLLLLTCCLTLRLAPGILGILHLLRAGLFCALLSSGIACSGNAWPGYLCIRIV